ncbi:MAG TPA: hypothetical protein VF310_13370 [Vicinamibacteria bacterium]
MKLGWASAALVMVACGAGAGPARAFAGMEDKVSVANTPPAVRKTIESELVGAQLEDIARKQRHGQTVYETDIIRNGEKWEVVIGEDGRILSKRQEGKAKEPAAGKKDGTATKGSDWRDRFEVDRADLLPTGNNPYLTMQPGRVLKLRKGVDTLTVTILPGAQEVDGVRVGILEERETKGGQLAEISRNFFATDRNTGDVYYFGEDVDNYRDGRIVDHESAWRAGVAGARFGLMVPAAPAVGQRFYQEIAPKVAMDRVEVVSISETVTVPAGTFEGCLHLRETTPLEGDVSHKYYAPGVGLIKDDEFELAEKPLG